MSQTPVRSDIPPADSSMWRYYVKYDRLSNIIYGAYAGSDDTKLNIFLDLYGITRNMIGMDKSGKGYTDYISVVSSVINICGHYREFFRRMGVYTKFYIINSCNCPDSNIMEYRGYNLDMRNKLVNKMSIISGVQTAASLLKVICPYIPDVFYFDSNFESAVVMYDIILRDKYESANMIISTDQYNYMLIPMGATLLRPIKSKAIDTNNLLDISDIFFCNSNGSNFWRGLIEIKRTTTADRDSYTLNPFYGSYVLAFSNVPYRDIKGRLPITTAIGLFEEAINANYLISQPASTIPPELVYDMIQRVNIEKKHNYKSLPSKEEYIAKFHVIDIPYQHMFFLQSNECKSMQFPNLNDVNGLMEINSKYLSQYPIDIDLL